MVIGSGFGSIQVPSNNYFTIYKYDFFNPNNLNFSEMYREILKTLPDEEQDNYDRKYEKACELLYVNRHYLWGLYDCDKHVDDPSCPDCTVFQYNKDKCFKIGSYRVDIKHCFLNDEEKRAYDNFKFKKQILIDDVIEPSLEIEDEKDDKRSFPVTKWWAMEKDK